MATCSRYSNDCFADEKRFYQQICCRPTIRHAPPKCDEEVVKSRSVAVPQKTKQDTQWCLRLWKDWSISRNYNCQGQKVLLEDQLASSSRQYISYSIERFVLEVRNKHGEEYSPTTLHHIVCGILRHIRSVQPCMDFFTEKEFAEFRKTLDGEMKRLQSKGVGAQIKKAEILTNEDEELLWTKGLLGDHDPQTLL